MAHHQLFSLTIYSLQLIKIFLWILSCLTFAFAYADKMYLCDGTAHCSDNSDESNCCAGHQCGSTCIQSAKVCDGWNHCADGSDETPAACAAHKHKPDHQHSANAHVLIAGFIVFTCLVLTAVTVYRCRMT